MRKAVKITAAVLCVLMILSLGAGYAVYYTVIYAGSSKDILFEAEQNRMDIAEDNTDELDTVEVEYEEREIVSHDGLKLHSWMIPQSRDVFVIAVHGYTDNGKVAGMLCGGFYARGYSLLLPDLRGQGESEGDYIGFGWDDRLDILSWIDWLNKEYDDPRIVLYGVSMGASCVLMTSGEKLPSNVKCIISDSAYTSVRDEFAYEARTLMHLPYFPVLSAADMFTRAFAGYSFEEADACRQVAESSTPTLFIHGTEDTFVPFDNMQKLYDACSAKKAYYAAEGSSHCMAQFDNFERYWTEVFDFMDRYLQR